MTKRKEKLLKVRLDDFDWSMLEKLIDKKQTTKSKMIRYLIEKEYIEQNEKENW